MIVQMFEKEQSNNKTLPDALSHASVFENDGTDSNHV